ncbi:MAG: hypothetical protein ACI9QQ_003080, partial [Myxococcota bacterium]
EVTVWINESGQQCCLAELHNFGFGASVLHDRGLAADFQNATILYCDGSGYITIDVDGHDIAYVNAVRHRDWAGGRRRTSHHESRKRQQGNKRADHDVLLELS